MLDDVYVVSVDDEVMHYVMFVLHDMMLQALHAACAALSLSFSLRHEALCLCAPSGAL